MSAETKLMERLRYYAQNNEMIDQHFTESGRGLCEAADAIGRLQAAYQDLQREYDEVCGRRAELRAERDALKKLITDHNDACQDLCGQGDQEAVRCQYRPYFEANGRRCTQCPTDWILELPDALAAQETTPNDDAMADYRNDLSKERP